MTLADSIVWNALILVVTPVVMLAYPLSDETVRLVIILVFIHNLFNAAVFPASNALSNGLRAAGDVSYTMYVAVASTIIIRFVLSVVLVIWLDLGVIGVAATMCCDWVVRAVLFLRRFHSGGNSIVYMTTAMTPAGLMAIYDALDWPPGENVAVYGNTAMRYQAAAAPAECACLLGLTRAHDDFMIVNKYDR